MARTRPQRPDKLSMIVFSGSYEKVHYALATAAAAAAIDMRVTLLFTMDATRALTVPDGEGRPGWHRLPVERVGYPDAASLDSTLRQRGVVGIEELLESCVSLRVRMLVCEMGLRAVDLAEATIRRDAGIEIGGLVTFLTGASADGAMLFV